MKHPPAFLFLLLAGMALLAQSGADIASVLRAQGPDVPAAAVPVHLTTRVDRTALWVGDRIHYRVLAEHPPAIHFVTDNLKESSLNLLPFEIVSINFATGEGSAGNRTLLVDLILTTYQTTPGELEIPAFSLFFFQDDAAVASGAERAAESLSVPAVPIALRSTLPAEHNELRDLPTPPATPWRRRLAGTLPMVFLLLSLLLAAPALLQGRRLRSDQHAIRARRTRRANAAAELLSLSSRGIGDEAAAADFFDATHAALREFLAASSLTATSGKMAREVSELLRDGSALAPDAPAAALAAVPELLQLCDQVRYAPAGSEMGLKNFAAAQERIRVLLGSL